MYGTSTKKTVGNIVIALFCALAYASEWVFHFKVSFLSFDIKDAVIAIAAMALGPSNALIMGALVALLEFITISDTGAYGLIMNVISTCVFTGLSSLIYKYRRTLGGAILGLVSSCVATTAVMAVANLIVTPFFMRTSVDVVLAMLPTLILPFNFIKYIFNSAVVMLLYKPVTSALRYSGIRVGNAGAGVAAADAPGNGVPDSKGKRIARVAIVVGSLAVIVLSIAIILFVLDGSVVVGK